MKDMNEIQKYSAVSKEEELIIKKDLLKQVWALINPEVWLKIKLMQTKPGPDQVSIQKFFDSNDQYSDISDYYANM